ncbi:MAG: glycosyltransferase family 4 protein [Methylacidiphilales bacterium]|nr:glycosyltransferase family 4 protein [Candidatus Methylacidiphilales bacterium]
MLRLLYLYGEEITGKRAREIHTLNRCLSLCRAGLRVDLVVAESPAFPSDTLLFKAFGLAAHENLSITRLPRRWKLGPFSVTSSRHYYRQVEHLLAGAAHFDATYAIHLKAAQFLQKSLPDLPTVFEAHEIFADAWPEGCGKFLKLSRQESEVYGRARAVVATSAYLLGELQRRYKMPEKVFISPNCADESFFLDASDSQDRNELIYVGSFQGWKGVPTAVAAMRHLPEHHLTVVGGSAEQVRALSAHAPANVSFTGFLSRKKILPLLSRASIGLLPNRLEPKNSLYTFPMKFLEYAAANKKIVATDLPVLRELGPGPWVAFAPPDDPKALAEAVLALSSRNAGHEPRDWALNYRWDARALVLAQFLQEFA